MLVCPLLQRGVAGDQPVIGPGVAEHRILARREGARLDAAAGGDRRGDRHGQLDPQAGGHVDDQVADERRPGRRDALAAQPAEQLGKGLVHGGGQAVHGDGHRDRGIVLRGALLDLWLVAHLVAFRFRWRVPSAPLSAGMRSAGTPV